MSEPRRVERTPIPEPAEQVEEEAGEQLPTFDPTKPIIISAWGRKGAGKSTFNRRVYRSWKGDKLCIDVNGEAEPGPDAITLTTEQIREGRFPPPPATMPGQPRPGPRNLYWRADPLAPTYEDDLDRAIGLALFPQDHPVLVWAGEVGEFMPSAQRTRPHMRTLLMQSRHYRVTALFDGPRPAHVNKLVLGQSDYVVIYHLPDPDDRERIAKEIGYKAKRFDAECDETFRRGDFWFLFWDARAHTLYRCPPLPPLEDDEPAEPDKR